MYGVKIHTLDNPGWWVEIEGVFGDLPEGSPHKGKTGEYDGDPEFEWEYEAGKSILHGVTLNPCALDALLVILADVLKKFPVKPKRVWQATQGK